MKIVSIVNQKGGVGKTTTAVSLSAVLAERGVRVLLIDLDPQSSATSAVGATEESGVSLYPALIGQGNLKNAIRATQYQNLWMIPSERDLAGVEIEIARSDDGGITRLRDVLHPLRSERIYDIAFVDCPPSVGILMTQALAAADSVLIPLQCEYLSLEGLSRMLQYIERVRVAANPTLEIEGVLMTMFDGRTKLAQSVVNDVRTHLGDRVFNTVIPRSVRLGEAPSFGKPITHYDGSSTGAVAYRALGDEFLQRNGVNPADLVETTAAEQPAPAAAS